MLFNSIIGTETLGINPKVNNLVLPCERAKHEIFWIIDSNVYVQPTALRVAVGHLLSQRIGVVHHLPFATHAETLGSKLELTYLNTMHARMYLAINAVGIASCVIGKSNLYRKSDLMAVGGFKRYTMVMAEDNLIAQAIFDRGMRHRIGPHLAYQPLGALSLKGHIMRRVRWTRIRRYTVPGFAVALEPFTETIVCGLLAAFGFNRLYNISFWQFFLAHLLGCFLADIIFITHLMQQSIFSIPYFAVTWTLRECLALPLWIYALSGSSVEWRKSKFYLMPNGTALR